MEALPEVVKSMPAGKQAELAALLLNDLGPEGEFFWYFLALLTSPVRAKLVQWGAAIAEEEGKPF